MLEECLYGGQVRNLILIGVCTNIKSPRLGWVTWWEEVLYLLGSGSCGSRRVGKPFPKKFLPLNGKIDDYI